MSEQNHGLCVPESLRPGKGMGSEGQSLLPPFDLSEKLQLLFKNKHDPNSQESDGRYSDNEKNFDVRYSYVSHSS